MSEKKVLCTMCNIVKSYDKKAASIFEPLNLSLYENEIIGIKGSNGAGKSTLLKIIAGVVQPDQGNCTYSENVRKKISYVPQEMSLYQTMTGFENLKFWGIAQGLPAKAIKIRSNWLLSQLQLAEQGNKKVSTYSGGMKRRLHLGTALMATPKLLLLDEPTVGADMESMNMIRELLVHFRNIGCGIVLVSHQEGELEKICDRVLILEKGVLTIEKEHSYETATRREAQSL